MKRIDQKDTDWIIWCGACDEKVPTVVDYTTEDREYNHFICEACLRKALALLEEKK